MQGNIEMYKVLRKKVPLNGLPIDCNVEKFTGLTIKRLHSPVLPRYFGCSDGHIYQIKSGDDKYTILNEVKRKDLKNPYLSVIVRKECGKWATMNVHSLMCRAFHGERPSGGNICACHRDGDKNNNRPDNLVWMSARQNLSHKFLHGTHDSGTNNSRSVLDNEKLFVMRWLLENSGLSIFEISEILMVQRLMVTKVSLGDRYGNINVSVVAKVVESKIKEATLAGAVLETGNDISEVL